MTLRKGVPAVSGLLIAAQVLLTTAVRAAEIYANDAPPPPKQQRMPHPRDGMIWAPGHWEWSSQAYYWFDGTWLVERRKRHWVPARWERTGNRWHFLPGHWERQK
jgi:WXXGXW repeat (2 copies)